VIVVDDRSPDACGEIADEFVARDPRVRAVHLAPAALVRVRAADVCPHEVIASGPRHLARAACVDAKTAGVVEGIVKK